MFNVCDIQKSCTSPPSLTATPHPPSSSANPSARTARSRIAPWPISPTGLPPASRPCAACCAANSTRPPTCRWPLNWDRSLGCSSCSNGWPKGWAARQERMEKALYRRYRARRGQPPRLFLYDVTSSYLEGEKNELGEYGYNRDGKRGKLQIVIGLLADEEGEPLAVRVFEGHRSDPTTVVEQIKILQEQFGVSELVFVGDRGMVKSQGKQALSAAGLRYITALTDPQIRRLLGQGTLQLNLFSEQVCEVEAEGVRYILRKNESEARREQGRLEDKLAKLEAKIAARNEQVRTHPRCQPEAGQRAMTAWVERYKLMGLVEIKLEGTQLKLERREEAITRALDLAGCYVVTTDVASTAMSAQQVHDSYVSLAKVERDLRTLKTGLLEVRPVWVRKESRTRGHVFCCLLALKVAREMERFFF